MPVDEEGEGEGGWEVGERERGRVGGEEVRKEQRRNMKLRRERERREARKRVWEAVEGWRKVFDGGKGGKYFRVGWVVGAEWGERRELCEKARKARPERKAMEEEGK